MDLLKITKFWRGLDKVASSKIGAPIVEAMRKPTNWGASLLVSTDNENIPWAPFKKPLKQSCLAVVSTAGFYLEGDEPFDVDATHGDASFRTIPSNFDREKLKIAHTHYPHARVNDDINVLFPIDRLKELVQAEVISRLSDNFYSFGFGMYMTEEFIAKPDGSAHQLAKKLKGDGVDYVLMVPA
ncbi:MAG: glycine/sarcosine/betaine reductase selenoprotein B family protein [Desulfocapsaceae bacterium]